MTVIVVGSGPAGIFAALGALEAGAQVLMIDAGLSLEADKQELRKRLSAKHVSEWSMLEQNAVRSLAQSTGNMHKSIFGSDFATRQAGDSRIRLEKCGGFYSHAVGGLSNIWGRGLEPPYPGEYEHWPFANAMEDAIRTVLAHLPLAANDDNLTRVMPVYKTDAAPYGVTRTSQELLRRWERHASLLNRAGIYFGQTRLAFRPKGGPEQSCQMCGMCSYGCAYGALFSADQLLPMLQQRFEGRFEYRPGLLVRQFASREDGISITAENLASGTEETLTAHKLIVAAGPFGTTAIAMQSLGISKAVLPNSDLFAVPLLKLFGKAPRESEYHTLSQLTLLINSRFVSTRAGAMHLFGQNPALDNAVLGIFPRALRPLAAKLLSPVLQRLYAGMLFMHSSDSAHIEAKTEGTVTVFKGTRRLRSTLVYIRLYLFMLANMLRTGLLPIPLAGGLMQCGRSFHQGSSLPIGGQGSMSCDASGQLKDRPNVYIADACSLPEVQGGSFTLSIMANAYRIGKGTFDDKSM